MDSSFCEQNPKHKTAITSPSKPGLYPFASRAISQECLNNFICITNARLLAYDMDGKVLGLDDNGIAGMCFWILNQPVHRRLTCDMFTHLKLITNGFG